MKKFKWHLKKVSGNVKTNYEQLINVLTQTEVCLNSCPLARMIPTSNEDVEAMTPVIFYLEDHCVLCQIEL